MSKNTKFAKPTRSRSRRLFEIYAKCISSMYTNILKKSSPFISLQSGTPNLAFVSVSPFGGICVNLISFSTKIAGIERNIWQTGSPIIPLRSMLDDPKPSMERSEEIGERCDKFLKLTHIPLEGD